MARIAHIHWQFQFKGGGENVAMHVLEALRDEHDITLLTESPVNFDELNDHFGTDVQDIEVEIPSRAGVPSDTLLSLMRNRLHGGRFGFLRPLPLIIANWVCEPYFRDADLVINTTCEMVSDKPTIQYVHYPLHNRYRNPYSTPPENALFDWTNQLFLRAEGLNSIPDDHLMLTNSGWTADLLDTMYDTQPRVVYPPIDTSDFGDTPAPEERENGFVILGRITPGKKILRAIDIIEGVRSCGHDVHLHIVGATSDEEYAKKVRKTAAERRFVSFEGQVSREELVRILETHRYGIHAQEYEHFGMAVAELVAAGILPFVHDSGGQRGIVNTQLQLMYNNEDDGVRKINEVLFGSGLESKLRAGLPDIDEKYGARHFKQKIRKIVDEALA